VRLRVEVSLSCWYNLQDGVAWFTTEKAFGQLRKPEHKTGREGFWRQHVHTLFGDYLHTLRRGQIKA
jgi:hypothetical protein